MRDVAGGSGPWGIMLVSKQGLSQRHLHLEIGSDCFACRAGGPGPGGKEREQVAN